MHHHKNFLFIDLNDIEVIMVDDCSTDNSKNIIKEYSEKYSNFIDIYHETNSGGAAVPRNTGMKHASGKYLMFLDPDDEYAPDMCETLYNKIEEKNVNLVKCNHKMVYSNFTRTDYLYDKYIDEVELNCKTDLPPDKVSVCNVIHKKEFLDKHNILFKQIKSGEDMLFSMMEYLNSEKMIYLNNYNGYKYHFDEMISHSMIPTKKNLDDVFYSYYELRNILQKENRYDIIQDLYSKRTVSIFLRLINYEGDKKEYLKKFYDLEKSL